MSKKQRTPESSPLDNLTYDVITIIQKKAKALEAFDKYLQDAREDEELSELLENIRDQDRECIEDLQHHLSRLLAESGHSAENDEDDEDDMDDDEDDDSEDEDDEATMSTQAEMSDAQRKKPAKKK